MLQDFQFAVRTLFRSPGFTATAAVTLALGIGVTSLMFSVVNAVLLRPLPYPDQERLMLVFTVNTGAAEANSIRASALDFEDFDTGAQLRREWPDTSARASPSAARVSRSWSSDRW
jgi:putative ABC transport system permease protein